MDDQSSKERDRFPDTRELYHILCTLWSSLYEANSTFFGNYLLAHSFLILACATILVKLPRTESSFPVLSASLMGLALAGNAFSVLLSWSWERATGKLRLVRWHLEQLEWDRQTTTSRDAKDTYVFLDYLRLRAGECLRRRRSAADDDSCFSGPLARLNPNTATRWADRVRPARSIPVVLLVIYEGFFAVALSKILPNALVIGFAMSGVLFLAALGLVQWPRCLR
jgi:hypothetical protein